MVVKERLARWFIRRILIPRTEVIDNPGFIIVRLTEKREKISIREIFFPESLLIKLENKIIEKYGDKGRQILYSVGKKFGYRLSLISRYANIKSNTEKELLDFIFYFLRYMECTFAKKLSFKADVKSKIYIMKMDEYSVCSQNGNGEILSSGGTAGVWAYMIQDSNVECVQVKCQGKGDDKCEVIAAPPYYFIKRKMKYFKETNLKNLELDIRYDILNSIRPSFYAKYSLKDLISQGFFKFGKNGIERHGERYLLMEASLLYILENELSRLKLGKNILFQVSFDFGYLVASREKPKNISNFITNYMSALGWGDILVIKKHGKYSIISNYFPWTKFADKTDFIIYRGIISGLLSGFENKKIILDKISSDISQKYFRVIISQK